MSKQKHTPGPWAVYYRAGGVGWPGGIVTESPLYDHERPEVVPGEMWNRCMVARFHINDFDRLAHVYSDRSVSFATLPEHDANARLIAAAPRMYDRISLLATDGDAESIQIMEQIHGRS